MLGQDLTPSQFDLIATVGPSTVSAACLDDLSGSGATIFRLNGAHEKPDGLAAKVKHIRSAVGSSARLMLDIPGSKVRARNLDAPVQLSEGDRFSMGHDQTTHPEFLPSLQPGDEVTAGDGLLRLVVLEQMKDSTVFESLSEGKLSNNRGLHIQGRTSTGPFLQERDRALLDVARSIKIDMLSLSFVRSAADVRETREALGSSMVEIVAKIETRTAYNHLDGIMNEARYILIDRGDLASDIGLIDVPFAQQDIVRRAKSRGCSVYLATQFLHSMVYHSIPLIAEIESVYSAIASGVNGLQLSEETAVGRYPGEAVRLITDLCAKVKADYT